MVSLTCIPKLTKKIQRPRESMDLDNIMEGFDSEDDMGESVVHRLLLHFAAPALQQPPHLTRCPGPYPMPKDSSHSAYEEALKSPRSLTRARTSSSPMPAPSDHARSAGLALVIRLHRSSRPPLLYPIPRPSGTSNHGLQHAGKFGIHELSQCAAMGSRHPNTASVFFGRCFVPVAYVTAVRVTHFVLARTVLSHLALSRAILICLALGPTHFACLLSVISIARLAPTLRTSPSASPTSPSSPSPMLP
ncbi:uncharacterized protein BXZ73DRAFT_108800 [Epithele typhae]|uniref:uncharacterized protein n=1 Tax=Epithele typhae TaxID=378194 RepID=UPI0020072850|nr:uncharacterized protein BXZ73DRAFT_108800 [Epithele typhae]KAH9910568.1 hypothetical protein BXZ73DRAFT_108800 [Epithele typhae]